METGIGNQRSSLLPNTCATCGVISPAGFPWRARRSGSMYREVSANLSFPLWSTIITISMRVVVEDYTKSVKVQAKGLNTYNKGGKERLELA